MQRQKNYVTFYHNRNKMLKFAVAYVNAFDNDLQITIVEANDCIKGIIKGARIMMPANDKWLDDLYAKAVNTDSAIEMIQNNFFDCDSNIAICEIE